MLTWAEREARPRIFQMVTALRLRRACQFAFSRWRLRNAWLARRGDVAVGRGGLHWQAGVLPFTRRLLASAAAMVRGGAAEEGSRLHQFSLVLSMRARLLFARWRETCCWSDVYLARVLREALPRHAADVRRRRDVRERDREGNGQPVGMAHLRAVGVGACTRSMQSVLDDLGAHGERRLRAALHTQEAARSRVADARALEALTSDYLVMSSAWEACFRAGVGRRAALARPAAGRTARSVKAATPQTARSVSSMHSLTTHQSAVARIVIRPPRVDLSVPAAVSAAQSILARTGHVDVRTASEAPPVAAARGGRAARELFSDGVVAEASAAASGGAALAEGDAAATRPSKAAAAWRGGRRGAARAAVDETRREGGRVDGASAEKEAQ